MSPKQIAAASLAALLLATGIASTAETQPTPSTITPDLAEPTLSSNELNNFSKGINDAINQGDLKAAKILLQEARLAADRLRAEYAVAEQQFTDQEKQLQKIMEPEN